MSKNIYFASPLFSESEKLFNEVVVKKIREKYPESNVYLPQENLAINNKNAYANSKMIAIADTKELLKSDLIVALLDGQTIDAGVASEIGVAYAKDIPVLGLYTDSRQQGADNKQKLQALSETCENQFHYLNLYTTGLIKLNGEILTNVDELLDTIAKYMK